MMELLCPAGSMECLTAAIQNGADAVYFGGSMLNARRFADNFAGENLVKALDYCHERNVRAYITLNTLVFDRELFAALEFAEQLHRYGADAVLVQDLGLASIIRKELPELVIHASTQMGIHSIGGAQYCESIGIKRAVLAREVSLEQIAEIKNNTRIELEAFGHGALCMSFSGSCLYSSMAGERSGNRGTCAQPCRKAASVFGTPGNGDFCLSPNDICMIEHLPELERAGVCCIKLEGRMKKPEYVAAVTSCYREALDGAEPDRIPELKEKMFRFFNRGDFNTAHFFNDSVKTGRVGSSKPEPSDVSAARKSFDHESKKRNARLVFRLMAGEPAELQMACADKCVNAACPVPEAAEKLQSAESFAAKLRKLGDTPFAAESCEVITDGKSFLSAAALNAMRRSASDELAAAFHIRKPEIAVELPSAIKTGRSKAGENGKRPFVYAVVHSVSEAGSAFESGADAVGLDSVRMDRAEIEKLSKYRLNGKKLLLVLPNVIITKAQEDTVRNLLQSGFFDGAEANNIGQYSLIEKLPFKIAGIGLNALNTYSVSELLRIGFDYTIPSQELTAAQLETLTDEYAGRIILWLHGRVPLMQLVHCPVKEHRGCRNCEYESGFIEDEAKRRFPLTTVRFPDKCLVRLLNCNTTDLIDRLPSMPRTAGVRLGFAAEPESAVRERLTALRKVQNGETVQQYPDSTRGHWNRKVD